MNMNKKVISILFRAAAPPPPHYTVEELNPHSGFNSSRELTVNI
jgi:hypothetical protein